MTTPHDPAAPDAGRHHTPPSWSPPRPTAELVAAALATLGLPGLTPEAVAFPAPITRQGPAWRADIELPPGVPAGKVASRPGQVAAGLGVPAERVVLQGDPAGDARRLTLLVFDELVVAEDEMARYFPPRSSRLGPGCRWDPAGWEGSECNCPPAHPHLSAVAEWLWRVPRLWRVLESRVADRVWDWIDGPPCWRQHPPDEVADEQAARRHATTMRRLEWTTRIGWALLLALSLTVVGLTLARSSDPASPEPAPTTLAPTRSPAVPVPPPPTGTGPGPGPYVPVPAGPAGEPRPQP